MEQSFLPAHWSFLTRYYEGLSRPFASRIWQRMVDEVAKIAPQNARVADLGCGPGTVLRALGKRRPDVQLRGIDIDPEIIDIARRKDLHQSAAYEVASIARLPFADASVDIAISSLVFHHLDENTQQAAFREVQRILRPGGIFLLCDFSVPRRKWLTPIAATVLSVEASAPAQIRGRLLALAREHQATITTSWTLYGCVSLHHISFPHIPCTAR